MLNLKPGSEFIGAKLNYSEDETVLQTESFDLKFDSRDGKVKMQPAANGAIGFNELEWRPANSWKIFTNSKVYG